jgi:predicted transcriptional regulator of viral defense system
MNIVKVLGSIPQAQHGYFTRTQAAAAGIDDPQLTRATGRGFIDRVGHGVYRAAGAGYDENALLRVEWLRLTADTGPTERLIRPKVWVSHQSAAFVHHCGVYLPDQHSFIVTARVRTGPDVRVRRRTHGLRVEEWMVVDGLVVTTIERTAQDLVAAQGDGGHIGYMLWDAVETGKTTLERLETALGFDPSILIDQALSKFR